MGERGGGGKEERELNVSYILSKDVVMSLTTNKVDHKRQGENDGTVRCMNV